MLTKVLEQLTDSTIVVGYRSLNKFSRVQFEHSGPFNAAATLIFANIASQNSIEILVTQVTRTR